MLLPVQPPLPKSFPMKLLTLTLSSIVALAALTACRKEQTTTSERPVPVVPDRLQHTRLADVPSPLLQEFAGSPIHWQPLEPAVLEDARSSQRLVLAFVCSPRYSRTVELLRAIESTPSLVRQLNDEFVPVLVDFDVNRELALICTVLSAEQRQPVSFPFFLTVSPDGAPITWGTLADQHITDNIARLEGGLAVIRRLWSDNPDYVLTDSLDKLKSRQSRLLPGDPEVVDRKEREQILRRTIRQLASRYDDDPRTLYGVGGLIPTSSLETLALVGQSEFFDADQRQSVRAALNGLYDSLARSAMFDPLDGGAYSARVTDWQLPSFDRDCQGQASIIRALCRLHSLANCPGADQLALGAAAFAESRFQTPEGLFTSSVIRHDSKAENYLWTIEQVQTVLEPDEFKVWSETAELGHLGNIPPEADPARRFFRMNSLAIRQSPAEVAAALDMQEADVRQMLDAGRRKLLKTRTSRLPAPAKAEDASATASFEMLSAYCALFTATHDPVWREKAVRLGDQCREAFGKARFLNDRPGEDPSPGSDARAYTYAAAARAALDLGAITLDPAWTRWATDLMTLLSENFVTSEGRLVEAREVSKVIPLDLEDRTMVFSDSTYGLVRKNLVSFAKLDLAVPPLLKPWTRSLPASIEQAPIIYGDSLQALTLEFVATTVELGPDTTDDVVQATSSLPLQIVVRQRSEQGGSTVKCIAPDGSKRILSGPNDIAALIFHQP